MIFLLVASFPESIISFRGPLIEALLAKGIVLNVAAPGLPVGNVTRISLERLGVVVHDIPLRRTSTNAFFDLALVWHLYFLMRRIRPCAVLGYTIKPVIYGTFAAWLADVPRRFALVTGLGYAFTGARAGFITKLARHLYAWALIRTHKVFFQNPDDQALFRELGILAQATPSVIVNGSGVDVSDFHVEPLPVSPCRFLMIGRLLGDKGVREYERAAERVRALHPDIRFALAGWIDENPDSIQQDELDSWIARGCIDFHGRLSDVRPAIAACSVYVLPSYREGTPRTVLEAMAMGRAVITTDAPGCRETVVDGDNGFLVPVKSVDGLVAAMLRFIDEAELAQRMGARSRQIAEDKYDVNKVNEVMLREMGIADQRTSKVTQHG